MRKEAEFMNNRFFNLEQHTVSVSAVYALIHKG